MEQWLNDRLSECLEFDVPNEMIEYILNLKEPCAVDEYFETLLDFSVAEHRLFFQ